MVEVGAVGRVAVAMLPGPAVWSLVVEVVVEVVVAEKIRTMMMILMMTLPFQNQKNL